MEIFACLLFFCLSVLVAVYSFYAMKKSFDLSKNAIIVYEEVSQLVSRASELRGYIASDSKVISEKIDELLVQLKADDSRSSNGESQLNNLRKAFSQPIKVHERS